MDCKHGRTNSGLACHHHLWTSGHSRTVSGVACHHRPWTTNTVEQHQAWYAITAFGQHPRLDDVGRGMPSSPLGSTDVRLRWAWHYIIALGQHKRLAIVKRGMPSSSLNNTDSRPSSGVACHHSPWTAYTVGGRRAWHAIIAFGLADTVGRYRA